jgi:predicted esterase
MDNKLASAILVALLVGASIAVFALSSIDEESKDDTKSQNDDIDQGGIQTPPPNVEPTILVENRTFEWTGTNHTLQGYIVDEDPSSVSIEISIRNQDFSIHLTDISTQSDANGYWQVEFSESEPGQWLVQIKATDEEAATTERLIEYIVTVPNERDVDIVFSWTEPIENESTGLLSGAILHQFPETCSIKYHPLGSSSSNSIIGEVNATLGTYVISFDVSTTNNEGDIIADCGLYTTSTLTVRVDLPITPSSTDSDNDGIPDLSDDCDSTPDNEPVYGTGCSDSETDSDDDGVMNDVDLCPDTQVNRAVNPDGCSQYQLDADNDGISNAVDQCLNTPLGEQVDTTGCSDSQKDSDGDGVTDNLDECPNTLPGESVNEVGCVPSVPSPTSMKILALHGGGDSASGLASQQGMQDLVDALPEFEFVFASTPESGNIWYQDPPGGKGEPTTDPDWADLSISYLDQMVIDNGPFYALLGYSQGSAMIPVYMANTQNTFDRVMLYNGYLPTTHNGLMDRINTAAPFSTPAMIFSGENDGSFKDLAPALAQKFSGSLDLHSQTAGHHLPYETDEHFDQILTFIREGIEPYDPIDSWYCQDGSGPWVKDFNGDGNGYTANTNGVNSAGGSGSGPWFQCDVSVTVQNNEMVVESNGIPNHDFLSTMGCCAPEMDYTSTFPLNPVNDTTGGHDTTNCPASAGRWECVPDRGTVAMSVNGAPIFGPEEGPGGDAVALHFEYFNEDRQPIVLGWCTGHSAGPNGYHYHYDANCVYWEPEVGETMEDYDPSKIKSDEHSPIIGWAFDGYPIYGMYGYNQDQTSLKAITSSYAIERTQEGGDQGYNGIDDWNYVQGAGDLDECNGRFGPTPEYPDGIYHYVSTPLSGSPTMVTDTNGQTVGMIGFPYFLLCYHGVADVDGQDVGGGQGGGGGGPPGGGGGPPGGGAILYSFTPGMDYLVDQYEIEEILVDVSFSLLFLALIGAGLKRRKK